MDSLNILGRAEVVAFPGLGMSEVPARIDTGAKTSSIWVSQASEEDGVLSVVFLGKKQPNFTGKPMLFKDYDTVVVASSNGQSQTRFRVSLSVRLGGKRIKARFTLADRSRQVYPVLIGRNVLTGKFMVNVKAGKALLKEEKLRSKKLQSGNPSLKKGKV